MGRKAEREAMALADAYPQIPGRHTQTGTHLQAQAQWASLVAFFDAAFADNEDCKSTAGWIAYINGALIAYDSTTIKRVVGSSTEAECNAMAILAKRIHGTAACSANSST